MQSVHLIHRESYEIKKDITQNMFLQETRITFKDCEGFSGAVSSRFLEVFTVGKVLAFWNNGNKASRKCAKNAAFIHVSNKPNIQP